LPGLSEGVILIENGVDVTHEPQHVEFNEQWLNGPAKLIRYTDA